MADKIDIERLIRAIEKRTCLWDTGTDGYHDRQMKDLAWEDVCNEILEETWVSMEVEQKKKICADIKKKWNNLRDCYRREHNKIKNTPTGSSAKKIKQYIYADLLTFLYPILEKKNHTGNYGDEENTRSSEDQGTENNQNISNTQDMEHSSSSAGIEKSTTKIKRKEKDVPSQILQLIREKRNEQTHEPEDDDDKYLLSFRAELKAMTRSQKIDFKIGMLQLLRKITDTQYNRNTQSSFSSRLESHNTRTSYLRSPSPISNFSAYSPSPPTNDRRIINAPSTSFYSPNITTMRTTGSVPLFLVHPTHLQQEESTSTINATVPLNVTSTPMQQDQQQESTLHENDNHEEYVDDDNMSIYLKLKNQGYFNNN